MQKISGKCLCGSIQYASDAEPVFTIVCHCNDCQRQTGTAFSMTVGVPKQALVFKNEDRLKEYVGEAATGKKVQRKFCEDCGSPIISEIEVMPDLYMVKAGTLNDKSWLKPTHQFWCSSKHPWLELSEELEKHDRNPVK